MPPIISIVGNSDSGKTTLIEKLIPELRKRGYRVGTVKHASHGFEIDRRGKDSWRHHQAGAEIVVVASPQQIAMVKNDACESLDGLGKYFEGVDLVLAEGFKKEQRPKVEIFRSAVHRQPICLEDRNLIAMVTDAPLDVKVPRFDLEAVAALADLIEARFL